MKSPQFSTWSPSGELTKGGSVIGAFGVGAEAPSAFERDTQRLVTGPEVLMTGRGYGAGVDVPAESAAPVWKRLFDLVCIFLSLPVTLPLGMVIAGWVKLVSPGPIFFRQARVGKDGRIFQILKFRSMKVDAPTDSHEQHLERLIKSDVPMTKLDGVADPRILPGGRCLRAMGLDELPQLINVVRGEMSLVGPRPSTPNEYEMFTEGQKRRTKVLPGLTGYWQVSGKNKLTFQQMIALDLQYVAKMSLGLDLAIVVATIPAMFLQFMESRSVAPQLVREPVSDPAAVPEVL